MIKSVVAVLVLIFYFFLREQILKKMFCFVFFKLECSFIHSVYLHFHIPANICWLKKLSFTDAEIIQFYKFRLRPQEHCLTSIPCPYQGLTCN